jgi:hypothetical protein
LVKLNVAQSEMGSRSLYSDYFLYSSPCSTQFNYIFKRPVGSEDFKYFMAASGTTWVAVTAVTTVWTAVTATTTVWSAV